MQSKSGFASAVWTSVREKTQIADVVNLNNPRYTVRIGNLDGSSFLVASHQTANNDNGIITSTHLSVVAAHQHCLDGSDCARSG